MVRFLFALPRLVVALIVFSCATAVAQDTRMQVLVPVTVCTEVQAGFCVESELQYMETEARWVELPDGFGGAQRVFVYWHQGQWWWVGESEPNPAYAAYMAAQGFATSSDQTVVVPTAPTSVPAAAEPTSNEAHVGVNTPEDAQPIAAPEEQLTGRALRRTAMVEARAAARATAYGVRAAGQRVAAAVRLQRRENLALASVAVEPEVIEVLMPIEGETLEGDASVDAALVDAALVDPAAAELQAQTDGAVLADGTQVRALAITASIAAAVAGPVAVPPLAASITTETVVDAAVEPVIECVTYEDCGVDGVWDGYSICVESLCTEPAGLPLEDDAPLAPVEPLVVVPVVVPEPECETSEDCGDTNICDGITLCVESTCTPGGLPMIDDADPCTIDACDPELNQVVNTFSEDLCPPEVPLEVVPATVTPEVVPPIEEAALVVIPIPTAAEPECQLDADCDDALVCNGAEVCTEGSCGSGPLPVLDDGDDCTVDVCDASQNQIIHIRSAALCPDVVTAPPECVVNADCDDGAFCNGAETCSFGVCAAGPAPMVDDGVACTVDFCDESADTVQHEPLASRCDDGVFCNGAETCSASTGCVSGAAIVVDDGDPCTNDTCVEASRAVWNRYSAELCPAEPDATPQCATDRDCNDGLFCNGTESCETGVCVAGEPVIVDDGIPCTTDRCDEAQRRAVHVPEDRICDDGLFCNGTESCRAEIGCARGPAPVIDDGNNCTTDLCDEAGRRAVHFYDAQVCGPLPPGVAASTAPATDERDRLDRANETMRAVGAVTPDAVTPVVVTVNITNPEPTEPEPTEPAAPAEPVAPTEVNVAAPEVPPTEVQVVAPVSLETPVVRTPRGNTPPAAWSTVPADAACESHSDCDDDLFCNGEERCINFVCTPSENPPSREDDGIACTRTRCDEETDQVRHVAQHSQCGNGLFCDGLEMCDLTRGCIEGVSVFVDDGDPCTEDSCDEENDRIANEPIEGCGF